ncbi:MAG: trigger factor [Burkholderiaceae bacterium]|nr:trigger factor [Burkholderiaceae bacterium]
MTATTPATPSSLERRFQLSVSIAEVEQEAQKRLQRLSKSVKMPGFRPGKVPMKVVAQTYGAQAQSEAMSEVIGRVYGNAVVEQKLRVAGPPSIAPAKAESGSDQVLQFEAVVEVYPEVTCPDLAGVEIQKVTCAITDADLDRTIETLRKQRTNYEDVSRPSQKGDRVVLDFIGEIDGVAFTGGSSENYAFVLGDGSMLKEFDEAATSMKAGETKTFPLQFPADYHGKDVAGKLASFKIKIRSVGEPKLPALDEAFAKSMGVASGDLSKFREDVKNNLSREVASRCKAKTKTAVMDALNQWATFEVPKSLVQDESQRMADSTREDMAARGMNMKDVPIPADLFTEQATRRVKLGLLVGEIIRAKELRPTEEQIRSFVQDLAAAYERPEAFVSWFMGQPKQRAEAEAVVIEDNVVTWALAQAKVVDNAVSVEALMADAGQA